MKTMKLLFTLTLSILFFASCSDDDNEDKSLNDLSGRYKIVSMKSSASLDLDNDGMKSDDVLKEIARYESTVNYASVVSYDKEKNEGHVSVPYPFQSVMDEDEDTPLLYFFVTQFVRFSYKLDVNGDCVYFR